MLEPIRNAVFATDTNIRVRKQADIKKLDNFRVPRDRKYRRNSEAHPRYHRMAGTLGVVHAFLSSCEFNKTASVPWPVSQGWRPPVSTSLSLVHAFSFLAYSTIDWKHMPPITRLSRLLTILARLPGGGPPRVQRLPFRLLAPFHSLVSFRFIRLLLHHPTSAQVSRFEPTIKTFDIYFRCLRGDRRCFE